ncbi:MAG: VWA domain-containing protein [Byssovorax sp.]
MKVRNVALLSCAGMLLTSATVYSFAPSGLPAVALPSVPEIKPAVVVSDAVGASFEAPGTLHLEGRIGNASLPAGGAGETFVLLEVKNEAGDQAKVSAPSHLALVIDRSGSMAGARLDNAIAGALAAVDRLAEGDMVSVVAFDTKPSVVVPATEVSASSRGRIREAIRGITLGGDTCISCGIEEAVSQFVAGSGKVHRMILLSDGDATAGVRDVPGFRSIAQRARERGVSVSTVGVGVSYNQKILGSIAQEAGGGHYFIEDSRSLDRVFQAEADALRTTVAVNAEAEVELGPGVELVQVFDRSFQKRGQKVVVPLGSFTQGETKTVLLKVRVPSRSEGLAKVAEVGLGFRDLVRGEDGRAGGKLGLMVSRDATAAAELDGVVEGRVQRAETAAALLAANDLAERGKLDEAQQRLASRQRELSSAAARARQAAPAKRGRDVEEDFKGQSSSLDEANRSFDKNAPKKPDVAVRRNQEMANPFMK